MDEKKGIPFAQFKLYCTSGVTYTGHVEGLGEAHWVKQMVPVDLPDDLPINATMKRTYVTVSSLYINRTPSKNPLLATEILQSMNGEKVEHMKRAEMENERFRQLTVSLLTAVNTVNAVYGNVKTYQSASKVPVTLGSKYVAVNKGGTLVRNPNRVHTTKGELATKAGQKLFMLGVLIDAALVVAGRQSFEEAVANSVINMGILYIGGICPPLGIVLGVGYLVISFANTEDYASPGSYEEMHGSIAPADNTRVNNPLKR